MKNGIDMKKALFDDCETDLERSEFFASGRACETGIVAPSCAMRIARAFHAASVIGEISYPRTEGGMMTDIPQGYETQDLPKDYTGKVWIEGQLRAYGQACAAAERELAAMIVQANAEVCTGGLRTALMSNAAAIRAMDGNT